MKIKGISQFSILTVLGILLLLAGVGMSIKSQDGVDLSTLLFMGAAALFLGALPLLHFSMTKPLSHLKKEVDAFSRAWIGEETENLDSIRNVANGLYRVHEEVDHAKLRVKELEATINVYSTEKKQMETILRSLPIAVLVTDRFNELILSNDVAMGLFDFEGESCQGKPVGDILNWTELVDLIHGTSDRKVKVPRRQVELAYQEDGEDPKVFKVILSSITDHSDQVLGVVTIIQDATKDREIDRMKSEFVANVSHELKTPLSSIKAYTEMLIDGEAKDEESRQEFCSIIEAESNRLSQMIETLLDLSKLEAGVVQMSMERVNLITMLKSMVDTLRPAAEKKKITLSSDVSQYIVPVMGDKSQLNRVFVNLVSNAIKYTPEGGTVDITARLEGDLIRVDVADTGYGIPEADLDNIFEKFFRVKENANVAQGTGMGLAMVKKILESHNADIKVKSKTGEGSCFSVFIPAEH